MIVCAPHLFSCVRICLNCHFQSAIPDSQLEFENHFGSFDIKNVRTTSHLVSAVTHGCLSWAPAASQCLHLSQAPLQQATGAETGTEAEADAGMGIGTGTGTGAGPGS